MTDEISITAEDHDPARVAKGALKDEIWEICEILFIAQENLKVLRYLGSPESDPYRAAVKTRSMFFDFSQKMSWRIVVTELYKLFTPDENFSISALIEKLSDGEFAGIIAEEKIKQWKERTGRLGNTIKKIRNQRNKSVAHKDRAGLNQKKNGVRLDQADALIVIVQEIAREIYFEINQSHFAVEDPINAPVDDLKSLVRDLGEKRKADLAPLVALGKQYGLTNL